MNKCICRYCGKTLLLEDAVVSLTYWNQIKFFVHPECKLAGEKQEAFDCQCIDADCNDCKHFKRGKLAPQTISQLHKFNGDLVPVIHQPNVFNGHCLKLNKPTSANPNKWTGHSCFEHRRA